MPPLGQPVILHICGFAVLSWEGQGFPHVKMRLPTLTRLNPKLGIAGSALIECQKGPEDGMPTGPMMLGCTPILKSKSVSSSEL